MGFTVITYNQCIPDTVATSNPNDSTAGSASYSETTAGVSETNSGQDEVTTAENNQSEAVTGIIETSTIQMDVTASQTESSTGQTVENAAGDSYTATPSKQSQIEKYPILTIFGKHGFV